MKRALMALFVATFVFSSCSVLDRKPTIYYNEEELTLEEIAQMADLIVHIEDGRIVGGEKDVEGKK